MNDAVIEQLRAGAERAFGGSPVRFALLFGSHARGEAGPGSDIDLAVSIGDANIDRFPFTLDLQRRLHEHTGHECEVVILEDATLRVLDRILYEGILIHDADPVARVRYVAQTRRRAGDFAIHADRLDRELLRATADGRR